MVLQSVQGETYHVAPRLYAHWQRNSLAAMKKQNSDRVYIVDGHERIGKSQWAMQQFGVLEPEVFLNVDEFLSRVCFTPEDFFRAVRNVHNGVIIFDEAFRGLSSRSALSKVNRKLIQALMEMGQNNNIVFIVLPSFFLLDIYPAMLRSNGLFNIYLDKKGGKRCWRGYNKQDKNRIYQYGLKKGWTYGIGTAFKGNFYNKFPGGKIFMDAYLEKKRKALIEMDKSFTEATEKISRFEIQRNNMILAKYNEVKNYSEVSRWLKTSGTSLSSESVRDAVMKARKLAQLPQI